MTPQELTQLAGPVCRWWPPFLTLATVPALLASSGRAEAAELYRPRRCASRDQAQYILRRLFGQLRRQLERVAPRAGRVSAWSGYQDEGCHYSAADRTAKDRFVYRALARFVPGARVLDVGANLGRHSRIAAQGKTSCRWSWTWPSPVPVWVGEMPSAGPFWNARRAGLTWCCC
jgi:hypothetical protein